MSPLRGPEDGEGLDRRSHGVAACAEPRRFSSPCTTIGLRFDDAPALTQAALRLRWLGWTAASDGRIDVDYELRTSPSCGAVTSPATYELRCDGALVYQSVDLPQVIDAFEHHAKVLTALRAEGRLFVHAGAVAWQGRGILLPGASHCGKTTLVRALLAAGATYYSDDFAVLDHRGWLHPYPMPLSVRAADGLPRPGRRIEVAAGRIGTRAVPVRLVVVTTYRRHARWRPRLLSPGRTFLALIEHTVTARRAPDTVMAMLRPAALDARAVTTTRGDARRAAAAIIAEADALP